MPISCLLLLGTFILPALRAAAESGRRVALAGHNVPKEAASATLVGRVEADRPISLMFVLPLRDAQGCADLLRKLYDPADPSYHRFLTTSQFSDRFAPSIEDVSTITRYARSHGFSIDEIAGNRMAVTAHGPASAVESAFQVHLHDYVSQDGTRFRAPDREPTVPAQIAGRLLAVTGFDNMPAATPNSRRVLPSRASFSDLSVTMPSDFVGGTGPSGFLAPSNIKTMYSLDTVSATGSGQTLGLFELDGYTASDIAAYEKEFYPSLPPVALQNVLVDGYDGRPQTLPGASEVTLDIDMMIALAPGASRIIVYEADDTFSGLLAAYDEIASDDTASVVSSSWGLDETSANFYGIVNPESQIFEELAAQGQTLFAASGDSGAYADSWTLSVQDPVSQPYVTAVGGTSISLYYGMYQAESAWGELLDTSNLRPRGQGGGGGVSVLQTLPAYQRGITPGPYVSTTMRNVPDISLYGDYDTGGYAIYFTDPTNPASIGQWEGYNGTSAASPLWAGFAALVNQGRTASGRSAIGFLNPAIYAIGKNAAAHARDFHDVNDGTTNLYYPAVAGYDLATGWGSFIGNTLYTDLISSGTLPRVTTFSLASGAAGLTVTVTGGGFLGATTVAFDGVASRNFTVASDNRLTVTVPSGAKTGSIMVGNAFGSGISSTSFVVSAGVSPVIASITPSSAPTGTVVTILGSGFTGATEVTVGGASVGFMIVADNKIIFIVPTGLRGGVVTVTTPNGTAESTSRVGVPTWTAASVAAVADGTARVLWTRSDGAAGIWSLDANNKVVAVGPTYGPYSGNRSAWTAIAIGADADGTSRLLWSRDDGAAGIWTLNAAGVETMIGPTYGPYSGPTEKWTASGLSVAPDESVRLLWDRSDGAMGLWTLSPSDALVRMGPVYGPYSDREGNWTALGVGCAGDGTSRVLWARSDGVMGMWSFGPLDQQSLIGPTYSVDPPRGIGFWFPVSLSVSADGTSHVLWDNNNGAAGVWSMDSLDAVTTYGPVFGPFAPFTGFGISTFGGQSRLLWVQCNRAAGLWTLDSGNQETLIGPTYGPY